MEPAFLLTMDKHVGKSKGGAGPSLDLGQMDKVMPSVHIFQSIFFSDIYAFPLMTLNIPLHCLSNAAFLIFFLCFVFVSSHLCVTFAVVHAGAALARCPSLQ